MPPWGECGVVFLVSYFLKIFCDSFSFFLLMFSFCSCCCCFCCCCLVYNGCWCCIFKGVFFAVVALLSRLGGAFGGGGVLHRLALLQTHRWALLFSICRCHGYYRGYTMHVKISRVMLMHISLSKKLYKNSPRHCRRVDYSIAGLVARLESWFLWISNVS